MTTPDATRRPARTRNSAAEEGGAPVADAARMADLEAVLLALHRVQAVIEFTTDGIILDANDNFLSALGYRLDDVKGRHHRMFMPPGEADTAEYRRFWADLAGGKFQRGEFKRVGAGGREVWIEASYNPVFDASGAVTKVIKFAIDVTQQKVRSADYSGQIAAINRSQAVIEFNLDGTILTANDNFLGALGYTLDEVRGKHHRIFVDPAYAASKEYAKFWADLGAGTFQQAEYKRFGKGGAWSGSTPATTPSSISTAGR